MKTNTLGLSVFLMATAAAGSALAADTPTSTMPTASGAQINDLLIYERNIAADTNTSFFSSAASGVMQGPAVYGGTFLTFAQSISPVLAYDYKQEEAIGNLLNDIPNANTYVDKDSGSTLTLVQLHNLVLQDLQPLMQVSADLSTTTSIKSAASDLSSMAALSGMLVYQTQIEQVLFSKYFGTEVGGQIQIFTTELNTLTSIYQWLYTDASYIRFSSK